MQVPVLGGFAEVGTHGVRMLADHTGLGAEAEQHRMSQARLRALAHPAGAARPKQLDMALLHFFASTQRHKRRQNIWAKACLRAAGAGLAHGKAGYPQGSWQKMP